MSFSCGRKAKRLYKNYCLFFLTRMTILKLLPLLHQYCYCNWMDLKLKPSPGFLQTTRKYDDTKNGSINKIFVHTKWHTTSHHCGTVQFYSLFNSMSADGIKFSTRTLLPCVCSRRILIVPIHYYAARASLKTGTEIVPQ